MKKIKIAVIGAGGRSRNIVGQLFDAAQGNVEIVSVFDPKPEMLERFFERLKLPVMASAASVSEAINTPGVEWVIIASPNAMHKDQIIQAFAAGKNVFAEKPLATTIEDCVAIEEAHKAAGTMFATGFVLRYAPLYVKTKELLDSGRFGKILSIEANENILPEHGGYMITSWRRDKKIAGPHILEKCCHDMDLLEWFTGSLPTRVTAYAGRKFYLPERAYMMDKYPAGTLWVRQSPDQLDNPFLAGGEIDDTLFSIAEFRNGVFASFSCTMCNALPERRIRFHCEFGTLVVELYTMTIRYSLLGENTEEQIKVGGIGGIANHGGGDAVIMAELYKTMQEHTLPKCGGSEGLRSAVFSLALDKSAQEKRTIDMEEIWAKLGC